MEKMRKKYDFSRAKTNPYAKKLKKQITIRLDEETLAYFRDLSKMKMVRRLLCFEEFCLFFHFSPFPSQIPPAPAWDKSINANAPDHLVQPPKKC